MYKLGAEAHRGWIYQYSIIIVCKVEMEQMHFVFCLSLTCVLPRSSIDKFPDMVFLLFRSQQNPLSKLFLLQIDNLKKKQYSNIPSNCIYRVPIFRTYTYLYIHAPILYTSLV